MYRVQECLAGRERPELSAVRERLQRADADQRRRLLETLELVVDELWLDAFPPRSNDLSTRNNDLREILDGPLADLPPELKLPDLPEEQIKVGFLVEAERLLAGIGAYDRFARRVWMEIKDIYRRTGRPVRVLEVAAGTGLLAELISRRSRREELPLVLSAADIEPSMVSFVRQRLHKLGYQFKSFQADVTNLNDGNRTYDLVVNSYMLHHLSPGRAARALWEMHRVAAHKTIVFDVSRSRLLLLALDLWGMISRHPMRDLMRHDAVISVRRAYTPCELRLMLGWLGLRQRAHVLGGQSWNGSGWQLVMERS